MLVSSGRTALIKAALKKHGLTPSPELDTRTVQETVVEIMKMSGLPCHVLLRDHRNEWEDFSYADLHQYCTDAILGVVAQHTPTRQDTFAAESSFPQRNPSLNPTIVPPPPPLAPLTTTTTTAAAAASVVTSPANPSGVSPLSIVEEWLVSTGWQCHIEECRRHSLSFVLLKFLLEADKLGLWLTQKLKVDEYQVQVSSTSFGVSYRHLLCGTG